MNNDLRTVVGQHTGNFRMCLIKTHHGAQPSNGGVCYREQVIVAIGIQIPVVDAARCGVRQRTPHIGALDFSIAMNELAGVIQNEGRIEHVARKFVVDLKSRSADIGFMLEGKVLQ